MIDGVINHHTFLSAISITKILLHIKSCHTSSPSDGRHMKSAYLLCGISYTG